MKMVQLVIDFFFGIRRPDDDALSVAVEEAPAPRARARTRPPSRVSRHDRRSADRARRTAADGGPLTRRAALRAYGVRHTKRMLRNDLSDAHRADVAEWTRLWGVPGLEERLDIRFSGRLLRSLGRCNPSRGLIRLKPRLAVGDDALLREVVCHEVAHAAVFAIHRRRVRPHGKEWGALMRAAGYRPRATYKAPR